jgi:hypothetical protein
MDDINFTESDICYSTIKINDNEFVYKSNKVKLSKSKNEVDEYITHYFNNNSETTNMIDGDWHGWISLYDAIGDDNYNLEVSSKSLCWTINEFEFNDTYHKATIEIYFTDEAWLKLLKWGNFPLV